MFISKEIKNELVIIKAKIQKGDKPITDIEDLIHKIEGMSVENLRFITELESILKEIEDLKHKYNIE